MIESRNEHTIAASCQVRGRGYWSGREVCVEIEPAPVGTGVRLVRSDLPGKPASPANVDYACDASFRTNLRCGTACFAMVEHLLAALAALEIDNCRVLIDGEELPGLDGSSRDYVEALRHAGLIVQARTRDRLVIAEPVRVEGDGCWLEALPSVDGGSHFEYRLSYDDETPIPPQTFLHKLSPGGFARAVAAARTFVTRRQAAALREQGLAGHVTPGDLLVFGEHGVIDNRLRYADECARHKTLDLIGDLSLVGVDLIGRFISFRGGHVLNAAMARTLARRLRAGSSTVEPRRAAA